MNNCVAKSSLPLLLALSMLLASAAQSQSASPYDREYPIIGYAGGETSDAISALRQQLNSGDLRLRFNQERGYLDSLLEALTISDSTQLLVFSKTSLQVGLVSAATPRAIYFNDEVYVAWIPGTESLEIAAMDPRLGPVFYTLNQRENDRPVFVRQMQQCLRCHDSFTLTGGGTPRFMMSSNYTGALGQLVSHEGSIITTSRTPIQSRWGGWFVTGSHGEQLHLGNIFVESAEDLEANSMARTGNRRDLSDLTDTGPYLTPHSDIVALLLVEHQIEVQNLITRVNYHGRTVLADERSSEQQKTRQLETLSEELLRSLFMVEQASFSSPVSGVSGFTTMFESLGPTDSQGRSLRELDLNTRLFKYPLSYLIYSDAFTALPDEIKNLLGLRISDVLQGRDSSGVFDHISTSDRQTITEILNETSEIRVALN